MSKELTVILSLRMAGYLAFMGNILLEAKPDLKGSGRKIYLFPKTEKLKEDMGKYNEFIKKVS